MSLPRLRPRVYLPVWLLCLLTACSGGGGSPSSSAPPPAMGSPPPTSTAAPSPPSAGLMGLWVGVWSSSLSTAGGAMAMRMDLDTPQGPVLMQGSPCGLSSQLAATLSGSVLTGELAYPGPQSFTVRLLATLTRTGDALTGSYGTGPSPRAGCGNDQGQWTLVRTAGHALIEVLLPVQSSLAAVVAVPLAYEGSQSIDPNIPGNLPLSLTFPTLNTVVLQTSASRTEGDWTCEDLRNCAITVTRATYPRPRNMNVVHYSCDWRVTALPIAQGDASVMGSLALDCGNSYGSRSRSAAVKLPVRIAADGTVVLRHPTTGEAITTGINLLTKTALDGVL